MKQLFNSFLVLAFLSIIITSCDNGDDPIPDVIESDANGMYFFNYGGEAGATITKYNLENKEASTDYYELQNNTTLNSKLEYAYAYKNRIYLLTNFSDQVIVLDSMFVQSQNGITTNIHNPRFCVGSGDYLYISCLGANPDWSKMPDTYIVKFNIITNTVEKTIPIAGGPEGLAVANQKLFVALNYKDSIGVIDINTEAITFIATPAVSSYFVEDEHENLYVSLLNSYSNYSETSGLAYINTASSSLEAVYQLNGVSTGYASVLAPNADLSKIYVLAADWGMPGSIYSFNTTTKEFTPFIENLNGINGLFVNPISTDDEIYVFGADSYSEPGTVKVYDQTGTLQSEFDCGISPNWAFYLKYEE